MTPDCAILIVGGGTGGCAAALAAAGLGYRVILSNGSYRLHPVEWNIGEAVGLLAALSLAKDVPPRSVRHRPPLLAEFQDLLRGQGIELAWPWDAVSRPTIATRVARERVEVDRELGIGASAVFRW